MPWFNIFGIILPCCFIVLCTTTAYGRQNKRSSLVFKRAADESALEGHVVEKSTVTSLVECGLKCARLLPDCKSLNYVKEGHLTTCEINNSSKSHVHEDDFVRQQNSKYFEPISVKNQKENQASSDVFTDGLWTLIARFSNNDTTNWMEDNGTWWYDRVEPYGDTLEPSNNADMISEAFWLQQGSEFKITKSDDPTHTALLTTTGNCLNGTTFRAKMKSYGVFRGTSIWAKDTCLGNCSVSYGGNYKNVKGFVMSQCDGNIQTRDNIGFWCHYGTGDGAVLMIGGGGVKCHRADHGIGITGADKATFQSRQNEYDFGNGAHSSVVSTTKLYSLNLWVRCHIE